MADFHRRDFFRDAARRIVEPLADFLAERLPTPPEHGFLRPPGAITETRFNETCLRCGNCVEICPVHCIFSLDSSHGPAAGTPAIDPDRAACVVCDGLHCTHVCPSGALLPLGDPKLIRMGLAEVYGSVCVRSQGESCTICVDRCPLGSAAIRFDDAGPPTVLEAGCVGCGICQLYCPTSPKAITVRPL
ncbi:MAG: 4Fe-4S dicluster domain-containing protein [Phycisphaerales bacterium]|nr:4Fe-4S dicluster domain-containing protein [Phycisphaerales bacterium]